MILGNTLSIVAKDLHRIPVGVKLIVLVMFLRTLSWGFVDPYFSIYMQGLVGSYSLVGLLGGLLALSSLLAVIPMTRLADRVKDTRLIEDGETLFLFAILSYICAGLFKSIPLLVLALILNGIAQTLIVIGAETYVRKHRTPGGEARSFGFYTALDYLGWTLGMIIGAFTISYYGFNWMFLIIVPSILLGFLILPRVQENGSPLIWRAFRLFLYRNHGLKKLKKDIKKLNPKVFTFLIFAFFDGVVRMFTLIFVPLYGQSIGLNLQNISLLMALMYLPYIFSFFFAEVADRRGKRNAMAVGLFMAALSFLLLSFIVHQVAVLVLVAIVSFSVALFRPAYNGAITQLTHRHMMGEVTSLQNLVIRLGMVFGSVLSGVVADVFGLKTTFWLIAVIAAVLGLVSVALRRREVLPVEL